MLSGEASFVELVLRMLVALLLMAPLVWFVTRAYARKSLFRVGGRSLKIVESISLGPQRSLIVVEAAGRYLLLGLSTGRIVLLREFSSEEWGSARDGERESARDEERARESDQVKE